jgi:hypothetical protein
MIQGVSSWGKNVLRTLLLLPDKLGSSNRHNYYISQAIRTTCASDARNRFINYLWKIERPGKGRDGGFGGKGIIWSWMFSNPKISVIHLWTTVNRISKRNSSETTRPHFRSCLHCIILEWFNCHNPLSTSETWRSADVSLAVIDDRK